VYVHGRVGIDLKEVSDIESFVTSFEDIKMNIGLRHGWHVGVKGYDFAFHELAHWGVQAINVTMRSQLEGPLRVIPVLQSRLQWIRFDFISETAWAILEGVVETERVGCVRNGCLYGCFGRDDTKRRFHG
jgi:hypothetical protein